MESGRCQEFLESGIADLEKLDLVCSGIVNRVLAVVVDTCKPQVWKGAQGKYTQWRKFVCVSMSSTRSAQS